MSTKQRTLATAVHATGIGLHSGQRVNMRLLPSPANTGIVFARVDLQPVVEIPIAATAVSDTRMASVLGEAHARVSTVEHLLSACFGLGLDNLRIELDAEEVPIMDGSAASFAYLLQSGGLRELQAPKQYLRVLQEVCITEGEGAAQKWVKMRPFEGYSLDFSIEFNHPAVDATGSQAVFDFATHSYLNDMARARTFGFVHEVEALRNMGLARGGSMDNAIVMDEYRVLNQGGLRYEDEFVRHKMLDAVGDLYLAGKVILGAYTAFKSGHAMNNKLLRALLAPGVCELVSGADLPADFKPLIYPPAEPGVSVERRR